MALRQRRDFVESEEGKATRQKLQTMVADTSYNTAPGYTNDSTTYTNNLIPFADKHMNYLVTHPAVNIEHYISNLRLMTRIR